MKVTWTSPEQVPAIQRWGVLPLYFAAAGTLGGPVGYIFVRPSVALGSDSISTQAWAILEGSVGLGIGFSVLVSRRIWVGVVASPLMALSAVLCAIVVRNATQREFDESLWKEVLRDLLDPFLLAFVFAQPAILTLAHSCALHLGRGKLVAMAAIYAAAGILWGALVLIVMGSRERMIPQAIVQGAVIGLFQFAGMAAAQAFSGVRPREEGGAA